jgi:hypothetical protein
MTLNFDRSDQAAKARNEKFRPLRVQFLLEKAGLDMSDDPPTPSKLPLTRGQIAAKRLALAKQLYLSGVPAVEAARATCLLEDDTQTTSFAAEVTKVVEKVKQLPVDTEDSVK